VTAGAIAPTTPIDVISWGEFSRPWQVDVQGALAWVQAALAAPLRPGSVVVLVSSGAAIVGSPLSGGYAGAKRMQWLIANYAQGLAQERQLGIRFQTVIPQQMVGGTGIGDAAAAAYSRKTGSTPAEFLARFGAPLTPEGFGGHVLAVIAADDAAVRAYGVKGDTGLTEVEVAGR
jgi:NADP-dependent 3-hydroxy acid dehydrogenase YdfG